MTELSSASHFQVISIKVGAVRILVIEDEPRILGFLARGLEAEGFAVDGARNGREGLRRAQRDPYDLVLLDLMMEGMDGFEVAALLKGDAATQQLPIVVLTAKEMDREDRERLHGKIEALVQKHDWNPARLEAVLRDVVRRQLRAATTRALP